MVNHRWFFSVHLILCFTVFSRADGQIPSWNSTSNLLTAWVELAHRLAESATDTPFTVLSSWNWGECYAGDVVGSHMLVSNGSMFQVLDVSNPGDPQLVWEQQLVTLVTTIEVQDTLAIVTAGNRLYFFSVRSPAWPKLLSSFDVTPLITATAREGSLVFLLGFTGDVICY